MHEPHVVGELARRAKVHESAAKSVLEALSGLVAEGKVAAPGGRGPSAHSFSPTDPRIVDDLIARARRHPQGTDFLQQGALDSVAASFEAHAFTVEAARERLRNRGDLE